MCDSRVGEGVARFLLDCGKFERDQRRCCWMMCAELWEPE